MELFKSVDAGIVFKSKPVAFEADGREYKIGDKPYVWKIKGTHEKFEFDRDFINKKTDKESGLSEFTVKEPGIYEYRGMASNYYKNSYYQKVEDGLSGFVIVKEDMTAQRIFKSQVREIFKDGTLEQALKGEVEIRTERKPRVSEDPVAPEVPAVETPVVEAPKAEVPAKKTKAKAEAPKVNLGAAKVEEPKAEAKASKKLK